MQAMRSTTVIACNAAISIVLDGLQHQQLGVIPQV
jgi:glutamate racemase